ncbi:hypothetical protein ACJX0J_020606, partial [Zea mays]
NKSGGQYVHMFLKKENNSLHTTVDQYHIEENQTSQRSLLGGSTSGAPMRLTFNSPNR